MKRIILSATLAVLLATGLYAAETAKIQIIHNAADPSAASVDIYVGETKALDDFQFRTATPFIELPAGVPLAIGVAPGTSMSVADALATFTVTLEPNGTYLAIANGVLAPETFASNPDTAVIAFNIFAIDQARTEAADTNTVDIKVFHGATDVGLVDVYAGAEKVLSGVGYGVSSLYLAVPPASYVFGVAPAGGAPIASFTADVSGLSGAAITVLASGFLDPSKNNDGPAFGLYAVTGAGGQFIQLPAAPVAEAAFVQIVHNSADPIADSVDVYLDGALAIDNFAFRTATAPIELVANQAYKIGVAPKTSTSAADTLVNFDVTLPAGRYVVFANGLVQSGFVANPSGEPTGFTIYPIGDIRTQAETSENLDFVVFHGATDAPAVDVRVDGTNIVSNLAYGKSTPYLSVPAQDYVIGVAPAGDDVIASYNVPGVALTGQSGIVFASGFLDPAANNNGPAFGLFALIGNDVVRLQEVTTSVNEAPELADASLAPNPTSGDILARFTMPSDGRVSIRVHDVAGNLVKEVALGTLLSGQHVVPVALTAAASTGGYIMTIDAGTHRSVVPFIVNR